MQRPMSEHELEQLAPFAQALRELRKTAGQPRVAQIAEATHLSIATVQVVLSGKRYTSRRAVEAVAATLGADPHLWGERWQVLGIERSRTSQPRNEQCEVEGCPNKPRGRFCSTHERHRRLYGDAVAGHFSPKSHPAVCSVEGCEQPYRAKGLCKRHYQRSLVSSRRAAGGSGQP